MGNLTPEPDYRIINRDSSESKTNLYFKIRNFLSNRNVRKFSLVIKSVRLAINTGSILYFLIKLLILLYPVLFN